MSNPFSKPSLRRAFHAAASVALFGWIIAFAPESAAAEDHIKIGALKIASSAPIYIADAKGYFTAEGIDIQIVFFGTGIDTVTAIVSHDIDFASTGLTGALFTFGGQHELRIIAGGTQMVPGFPLVPYIVSNKAAAAGLKSFKDLPGHSIGLAGFGSAPHYALHLLAQKYGFDLKKDVKMVVMPASANAIAAVIGGTLDVAMPPASLAVSVVEKDQAKLLGEAGDETPCQFNVIVASTATANGKRDLVERFLRAYRKGTRDYYDAFVGPDGRRKDGSTSHDVLAIISKYIDQPASSIELAIPFIDRDGGLNEKDVLRQIAWYHAEHYVKVPVKGDELIDARYVQDSGER